MRTDVRIGLAVGLGLLVLVVVYYALVSGEPPKPSEPPAVEAPTQTLPEITVPPAVAETPERLQFPEIAERSPAVQPDPLSGLPDVTTRPSPAATSRSFLRDFGPIADTSPPPLLIPKAAPRLPVAPSPSSPPIGGTAAPRLTAPPLATSARTYIVKEGDSFWTIAESEYGHGKYNEQIALANPNAKADQLRAGQKLTIPPLKTASVARVASPSTEGVLPPGYKTYIVKKDEGFWVIAQKVYGHGMHWPVLRQANPKLDPGRIPIGAEIVVPPLPGRVSGPGRITPAPVIPTAAGERTYTVTAGDTAGFWGIAKKVYGQSKYYSLIVKANPNVDPTRLRAGQKLIIPALTEEARSSHLPPVPRPEGKITPAADGRPIFD